MFGFQIDFDFQFFFLMIEKKEFIEQKRKIEGTKDYSFLLFHWMHEKVELEKLFMVYRKYKKNVCKQC